MAAYARWASETSGEPHKISIQASLKKNIKHSITRICEPIATELVLDAATLKGSTDNMSEPMQDSCADPIQNGTEETQYVSVEIDTQATDGYDDALLNDTIFKQISDVPPRAVPIPNTEPRYTVPLDHDDPVMDFKFAKPAHKQPVFRPTKPSADATRAPPRRDSTPTPGMSGDVQEESDGKGLVNFSKTALTIF